VTEISKNCIKLKFIDKQDISFRSSQFLDIYASKGSAATHMRCDGFFNDHFFARSLLSPPVEELL